MNIPLLPHDGSDPSFLVIDLFCGAGGVTTGFAMSGRAKVIACVNHDHTAIISHWKNHPEVHHFEEDIRALHLEPLVAVKNHYSKLYPRAKVVLHASLECPHYSKAKGGQPKDVDSRTLKNEMYRYIDALKPDIVTIENVVEFEDDGPVRIKVKKKHENYWELCTIKNKHGQTVYGYEAIPERKGEEFREWRDNICGRGYNTDWKRMNAANYGAYTSRERLYGVFAVDGIPIVWPKETHHKTGAHGLKKWKAVKEKLDFSNLGYSIFYRSKNKSIPKRFRTDICENTLERIYEGCIKHIAGGKKAFLSKYHGGRPESRNISTEAPLGVIDTENRYSLINVENAPAGELFDDSFIATYHGNGDNTHSVKRCAPTIPCGDNISIINPAFIHRAFSNGGSSSSIETAAGSILKEPKMDLVQAELAFIDNTNYNNTPKSANEPLGTITADRHWPYILNPAYGGHTHTVESTCPTIVARQDKAPLSVVIVEGGQYAIPIYEDDTPMVKKLKEFMALYGIIDIKMRMLTVKELMAIQGFPDTYILGGSQTEQKKHIGNSVEPNQICCWAIEMDEAIFKKAA